MLIKWSSEYNSIPPIISNLSHHSPRRIYGCSGTQYTWEATSDHFFNDDPSCNVDYAAPKPVSGRGHASGPYWTLNMTLNSHVSKWKVCGVGDMQPARANNPSGLHLLPQMCRSGVRLYLRLSVSRSGATLDQPVVQLPRMSRSRVLERNHPFLVK